MCGIVGYVGTRPALEFVLQGLKRLEYRGYDSAGVALRLKNGIEIEKAEGKLENTVLKLNAKNSLYSAATMGLGHTRWATHGKPTTQNAHPHRTGPIVLVHNGIIENYQEIKADLLRRGIKPQSETDSELLGFLIWDETKKGGSLQDAVRVAFRKIKGQSSVVVMSEEHPSLMVGARNGSPLVVAQDPKGGAAFASDAQPLLGLTKDVYFLEHGDLAVGTEKGLQFFSLDSGLSVERETTTLDWSADKLDKEGFPHFMLKEIFEQPTALVDTLNAAVDRKTAAPFALAPHLGVDVLAKAERLVMVACGSSWHAALVSKYWFEKIAGLSVAVELASEFRYASPVFTPGTVVLAISQSGETADILAVIRQAKSAKIPTLAITNVRGSTLSREADGVFFMAAGVEVGVAATKTFSSQMCLLLCLAGFRAARSNPAEARLVFDDFLKLPNLLAAELSPDSAWVKSVKQAAASVHASKGFFFIGRGTSFPLSLEGALKLKEIAYVHAEGYAAGELKHGPIAMIDAQMSVVVIAPQDHWRDKTVSNLEEVKARGGRILAIGAEKDHSLRELADSWISLPPSITSLHEALYPFLIAPALQLLSYELAVLMGTDIDQPRNLAKSVTVE